MIALSRHSSPTMPALLTGGFRPFFLLAALWGAVAVPLWLLLLAGRTDLPTAIPAVLWHGHEMLFGYALASLAGFLLTAVPSWTHRPPLQGAPLAALAALWLLGRVAMLLPGLPPLVVGALDLALLPVLMLVVAREIVAARNWHNLAVVATLAVLFAANLMIHLGAGDDVGIAMAGLRLSLATFCVLIALIGGRITPTFTRNWLAARRETSAIPASFGRFDRFVLIVTVGALAVWTIDPDARMGGILLIAAGILNALRARRWRAWAARREPLLLVLHVGYAWLWVGLILLGASQFAPALPPNAALHALTMGAVGTMTIAVMARASLGHTGRALTAGPPHTLMFALVSAAALSRIAASVLPDQYAMLLDLSGVAWSVAMAVFLSSFARILATNGEAACAAP